MVKEEYVTCPECDKSFIKKDKELRKHFRRLCVGKKQVGFHTLCKECEDKIKKETECKNGLLKCHICGEYLPIEEFGISDHYPYRNNRDGRCSKCRSKQSLENKRNYKGEYGLLKTLQTRFLCARERALRYNIPFTITKNDLKELWDKQQGLCAISKVPMTYIQGSGRINTNVSIDQIHPKDGYTINNIQLVCMAVNQMKSDLSTEELYMFCEAILKNKKK